jgi:hypothetical protein
VFLGKSHVTEGLMQVPSPDTLGRLWVWLHECYHMENHQHVWIGQPPSRQEAEALGTSSQLPFQSLTDAH